MKVLITGAGGFIGQELLAALVHDSSLSEIVLTDIVEPAIPRGASAYRAAIRSVSVDLTNEKARRVLLHSVTFDCIYLLHGIMSGAAEANLDLGLKVNLESQMAILDILRTTYPGTTKIIYASVGAVYGPIQANQVVSEQTVPMPQSSYGAQKLMIETLINDFSRRGLMDGRICRLPTVTIRAGAPTGAASSFASAIFREPLTGKRTILPVSRGQEMFISSPKTVIRNLIIASKIPKERFGLSRTVMLPGIKVSVQQMLDALEEVGGKAALALIDENVDEATNMIVASWPADYDTSRAASLGFAPDMSLRENVQEYVEQYVRGN